MNLSCSTLPTIGSTVVIGGTTEPIMTLTLTQCLCCPHHQIWRDKDWDPTRDLFNPCWDVECHRGED